MGRGTSASNCHIEVWDIQVDNQVVLPEENLVVPQVQDSGNKEKRDAEPSKATPVVKDFPRSFVPKAPVVKDLLNVIQINIPFLDAIQQVPSYAKFLKELITVKWRTNIPKKAFLTEQVSSILQCKLPIKYKDPGCQTTSCMIGVS
jgi:hypothetical protein